MTPATVVSVAVCGAAGAVLRAVVLRLNRPAARLPYATLAANAAGSFALGWAAGADIANAALAAGVSAGLLGGFTTYSTFALEAAAFARRKKRGRSVSYIAVTLAASIAAAGAGYAAVSVFA